MPVAVVVDESASGVPACLGPRLDQAGMLRDVGKGTVPVVPIKRVLAVVGHKEIIVAIVVVVAYATSLAPASLMFQAGARRHIGKCAIAVVLEKMTAGFLAGRKAFEPPAIDQEEIEPAIRVVVVEGQSAASGFQQILVGFLPAVDGLDRKAGLLHDVGEADAQGRSLQRRFGARRWRSRLCVVASFLRADLWWLLWRRGQGHDVGKGENQGAAAKRTDKPTAIQPRTPCFLSYHWPEAGLAAGCERLECLCQGTLSFEISGCLRRKSSE